MAQHGAQIQFPQTALHDGQVAPQKIAHSFIPGIDFGQLAAAYLGLSLMVAAMLAIGVCVSALFRHQLAAFITHLGILQVLWVSGDLVRRPGISADVLQYLNFVNHYYDNFFQGVVALSDIVYFASLVVLFLILGTYILAWGRWR